MNTKSFKSISESALRVMLGEAPVTDEVPNFGAGEAEDVPDTGAVLEPDEKDEPAAEKEKKPEKKEKSADRPKYAATCNKDGTESILLLSKDELETLIHENGTKCIVKLYELGKEAKVPEVKVKM